MRVQIEALDAMFGDPGLARLRRRASRHPAVIRRDMLAAFRPSEQLPLQDLLVTVRIVGSALIDRFSWMPPANAREYWSFVGDPLAADRIQHNIQDPSKFDETIAEVRTWAHLRERLKSAALLEEEGKPDIVINRAAVGERWVEVKFIHAETSDDGVLRALKKANKQLRKASSFGAGVVYLYLDRSTLARELPATPGKADSAAAAGVGPVREEDAPPEDVASRLIVVEAALASANFRSIAKVVVSWEDHFYLGSWPGKVSYLVRRQAVVRHHASPRAIVELDDEVLRPGLTAGFWLFSDDPRGHAAADAAAASMRRAFP